MIILVPAWWMRSRKASTARVAAGSRLAVGLSRDATWGFRAQAWARLLLTRQDTRRALGQMQQLGLFQGLCGKVLALLAKRALGSTPEPLSRLCLSVSAYYALSLAMLQWRRRR